MGWFPNARAEETISWHFRIVLQCSDRMRLVFGICSGCCLVWLAVFPVVPSLCFQFSSPFLCPQINFLRRFVLTFCSNVADLLRSAPGGKLKRDVEECAGVSFHGRLAPASFRFRACFSVLWLAVLCWADRFPMSTLYLLMCV